MLNLILILCVKAELIALMSLKYHFTKNATYAFRVMYQAVVLDFDLFNSFVLQCIYIVFNLLSYSVSIDFFLGFVTNNKRIIVNLLNFNASSESIYFKTV